MGARVTNGLTLEQQKERFEIVRREAERASLICLTASRKALRSARTSANPR
jgi:hypothetical protein